jgi:molecular chaperone DnaK
MGGVMTRLIERNTTIPVQKTEIFSTAADQQTAVDIHVLQGERPMAADNMTLGMFRLDGITPAPRGMPQVEVIFDIDANGILNVTAKDKATGKSQQITVTASTNLNQSEIDRLVREADKNRAEDERRAELAKARNEADSLVYQSTKALNELGERVPAEDRAMIERQIETLRKAMEGADLAAIHSASQALQNATYALNQQVSASQTNAAAGGSTGAGAYRGKPDEEVVEGEFSEG